MRRHSVAAFLLILGMGLMPLSAIAATTRDGWNTHSGFYFNTDVAPAVSHYDYTGPADELKAHSGGANVDFRFGYALNHHLVLSLDLNGTATVNRPDMTLNGTALHSATDYHFASAMAGAGLTWYFDNDLFLGVTAGSGQATFHYNNTDINSDNGFGAQIRMGKEWWLGDEWGLGVVGGLDYISAGANMHLDVVDSSGNVYTAHLDHVNTRTFFVGFTATFN